MESKHMERVRTRTSPEWRHRGFACNACGLAPTCPMLTDEVWRTISLADPNHFDCGNVDCKHPVRDHVLVRGTPSLCNSAGCKCQRYLKTRDLLCLECAESRLGRPIAFADLEPCVGNYHAAVVIERAQVLLREAAEELQRRRVDRYHDVSSGDLHDFDLDTVALVERLLHFG